jgi:Caspase domain
VIAPVLLMFVLNQAPGDQMRRFALVAGANDGGKSRVTLRYANSDARAVSKVLTQLGGVEARDIVLVEDPTPAELSLAFESLSVRLRNAEATASRLEVFFYYSGHSDDEGLLLKGEKLSYASLRAKLDALPAKVRIAVLDSCASGALNLLKGGSPRPAFLVDASSSLKGHAFLTSASADESAQESERLKASIFTYFFLSGLRGAADTSHDGRVTLGESYQYAYAETLARTTSTQAGPQRPAWDIQLVGTGDLVLTDVRTSDAQLVIESELEGRIYVRNARGNLVVEVAKPLGHPLELGLELGEYTATVDDQKGHVSERKLSFTTRQRIDLTRASMVPTTLERNVTRGNVAEPKENQTSEAVRPHLAFDLALVPPLSVSGYLPQPPRVNFALGIVGARVGAVDGLLLASAFGWSDGPVTGVAISGAVTKTGALTGVGLAGGLHDR